jgi:Na+/H+ antiporter NhaD/arsenite permease-like protein
MPSHWLTRALAAALPAFVSTKAATAPLATAFGIGILVALASNLVNNLPMGLFAGAAGAGRIGRPR